MIAASSPTPDAAPQSPDLRAELLLCITGIFPSASHPNQTDELAASGLLETYKNRLRRWMRAPDADDYQPREFDVTDPPEEKALQKKILDPIDDVELARLMSGLPDIAEAQLYVELVKHARQYLDDHWPKLPVPGIAADVFPLSTEELYDVWALARVLDNPDVLFDEVEACSLTIPMVDAWRTIYPNVASEVDKILDTLVIDRLAAKKSLTWQQADLFRMLRGVPLEAVIEIKKPEKKQPQQQPQQGAPQS